jgi:plasmid stabilization system protein ParE
LLPTTGRGGSSYSAGGLISKFPGLGRVKYQQAVRMLPVRRYPRYLVFYTVHHDEVVILNVRHGARRLPWESKKN